MRGISVATALSAAIGCLAPSTAMAQVIKEDVPGIRNFARVESTVACAGAITADAVAGIKKMGYSSIINLRLATEPGADVESTPRPPRWRASGTCTSPSALRTRTLRPSTPFSR